MRRYFTEHPATVGESYLQHLGMATGFGCRLCFAGLACLLHGLFPFLFVKTGSKTISDLHDRMVTNRCRKPDPRSSKQDHAPQAEDLLTQ